MYVEKILILCSTWVLDKKMGSIMKNPTTHISLIDFTIIVTVKKSINQ